MEGMIPIEEFKNDDEIKNLKVQNWRLPEIESFKGEIIIKIKRKIKSLEKNGESFWVQRVTGYIAN